MRIVFVHNIYYIFAKLSLANIRPRFSNKPIVHSRHRGRCTQKFKNNHFTFLKNTELRLFNRKESQSNSPVQLSSPTVQSNCPVQLSSPTVQSNCPVQLSSPVQSMFCTMPYTVTLTEEITDMFGQDTNLISFVYLQKQTCPSSFLLTYVLFILPRGTKLEYFTTLIHCLVTLERVYPFWETLCRYK